MYTLEQLEKDLIWFEAYHPTNRLIKLSKAKEIIELTLKSKLDASVIYEFLQLKKYRQIEIDLYIPKSLEEKYKKPTVKMPTTHDNDSISLNNFQSPIPGRCRDDDLEIDDLLDTALQPNNHSFTNDTLNNTQNKKAGSSFSTNLELLKKYDKTKDPILLQHIVTNNLNLVWTTVKKYQNYMGHSLSEDDLFQEGTFGLMRSIERFDYTLGGQFSTYALHWIRQRIVRAIIDKGTTVRIPVHMIELIRKVKSKESIFFFNGEPLDVRKLCDELGITEEKYRETKLIEHRFLSFTSLNTLLGQDDQDTELLDFIPNDHLQVLGSIPWEYEDPALVAEKLLLREEIHRLLSYLTEREENVIRLRFGIDDGRERTLEQVGKLYGVTRERIRQIEAKALRKLLKYVTKRKLSVS